MTINKLVILSLATCTSLYSAGYKIPEQSLNAVALSAAYIANANGADAAYYNPANMVFSSNENELEINMTYISLPKMSFSSSEYSKAEEFLIPTLHYVLPANLKDVKFGLSFLAPGGLSKRWDTPIGKTFSKEFTLEILEFNPSIAYKINTKFAIGGGLRLIKTHGIVKSDGIMNVIAGQNVTAKRDMSGDDLSLGYNLALTYKLTNDSTFAATYRSNVNLKIKGDAKLSSTKVNALGSFPGISASKVNSPASVKIPLPASLNLALSHTYNNLTIEAVYERTFWSKYKELDFTYDKTISNPILKGAFDDSKDKSWIDTNTYRLGLTYKTSPKLTIMAGIAYDETPVPTKTIGFELPDANAKIISTGFKYKLNKKSTLGLAYLLSFKDDKKVTHVNEQNISGEFTNSKVSLLTLSYNYKF